MKPKRKKKSIHETGEMECVPVCHRIINLFCFNLINVAQISSMKVTIDRQMISLWWIIKDQKRSYFRLVCNALNYIFTCSFSLMFAKRYFSCWRVLTWNFFWWKMRFGMRTVMQLPVVISVYVCVWRICNLKRWTNKIFYLFVGGDWWVCGTFFLL